MKKILLSLSIFATQSIFSQNPWIPTGSPTAGRYDDISFISPDTGWAVNSTGNILNTIDGGINWNVQKSSPGTYMRSIEFANKKIGFAGALEASGSNVFFKTTDGGVTWTDISSVITGTNRGICGICCVDTMVTYAVGVWSSPSYVMKTIDGGNTWTQINMGAYANALIDVQFIDANNGYVTGQSNISAEGAVILKTTDGGMSWSKVFTSNLAGEYLWKIQNLDGTNWFASVEAAGVPVNTTNNVFAKSIDGGNTWISKPVATSIYFQGIGFMTPQKGWIGNYSLYETNDGGDTWVEIMPYDNSNQFDRFQRINSTTAYFSSTKVNKLSNTTTAVKENKKNNERNWLSVYPNPAKTQISYHLDLPNKTMYYVRLFNANNEIIWEEVNQKEKGSYDFSISKKLEPGVYFVYVMFNEGVEYKKVIVE